MGWLDTVAGERGVERIDASFEFLNPALDTIPDAEDTKDVANTESAEGRSVSPRPIGNHCIRQVAVQVLNLFEKPSRRQIVSRWNHAEMNDFPRCGVERGEQHELLTVLDHGSLVEQNRGRKLGDGLAARRQESSAELLNLVPDGNV